MIIRKNFPKNRLPLAEARGLIGDFSSKGKFFGMLGNDRILKDAVFNVPDINKFQKHKKTSFLSDKFLKTLTICYANSQGARFRR